MRYCCLLKTKEDTLLGSLPNKFVRFFFSANRNVSFRIYNKARIGGMRAQYNRFDEKKYPK